MSTAEKLEKELTSSSIQIKQEVVANVPAAAKVGKTRRKLAMERCEARQAQRNAARKYPIVRDPKGESMTGLGGSGEGVSKKRKIDELGGLEEVQLDEDVSALWASLM